MGPEFAKEVEEKYPKTAAWHQRLVEMDSVKKTLKILGEKMG